MTEWDSLIGELTDAHRDFFANRQRAGAIKALAGVMNYLRSLGVESHLYAPIAAILAALVDAEAGRRNSLTTPALYAGGRKMKDREMMDLTAASAAVTIWKDDAHRPFKEALKEASQAIGKTQDELRYFRNNLTKGHAPGDAIQNYEFFLNLARSQQYAELTAEQRGRLCLEVATKWGTKSKRVIRSI